MLYVCIVCMQGRMNECKFHGYSKNLVFMIIIRIAEDEFTRLLDQIYSPHSVLAIATNVQISPIEGPSLDLTGQAGGDGNGLHEGEGVQVIHLQLAAVVPYGRVNAPGKEYIEMR